MTTKHGENRCTQVSGVAHVLTMFRHPLCIIRVLTHDMFYTNNNNDQHISLASIMLTDQGQKNFKQISRLLHIQYAIAILYIRVQYNLKEICITIFSKLAFFQKGNSN